MQYKYRFTRNPWLIATHLFTAPFIYAVFIPVVFLDIVLEIYHRVCFPIFGIEYVKRSEYIRLDRWKLPYLGIVDRIHCLYCEYVNGFFAFAVAVAGRTELYWCGIKHKSGGTFNEPQHHKDFFPYGDRSGIDRLEDTSV